MTESGRISPILPSFPFPSPVPYPLLSIQQPSTLLVVFLAMLLQSAAAIAAAPPPCPPHRIVASPPSTGPRRLAFLSRIRLRLLQSRIASSPDFPDLPQAHGHDPPDSATPTRPLDWILCPLAWFDPDPAIILENQPEATVSGELLDPDRRIPQPRHPVMLGPHIRAKQPSRLKDQADYQNRAGYPSQAEPGILQWLAFQPSRVSFWAQAMKPNGSPLGWCEFFTRSRRVWAQIFGPFTHG